MTATVGTSEETPSPVRQPRTTAWWVALLAYGLIALQLVVRGWVTFPSYFFQDDYAHLEMARRLGLSPEFLVRDYGGHLEMGQYVIVWLVSLVVDVSFWPAALSILLLQLAASLLLYRLLRALVGSDPLLLVGLSVYLFTPLALAWGTWWAAALQTLTLQIAMLATLLLLTRYLRTGERRWATWSVLAHVLGLLCWEKAALILPTALALTVLLLAPAPAGWRDRWQLLRGHWRFWAVHLGVLVAYVGLYVSVVGSPSEESGGFDLGRLLGQTLGRMYVPGIFGGPWHADGVENTLYPYAGTLTTVLTCALLAGLVTASVVLRGRRAWAAWVLLAGYLAMDLVLLGLGRPDWIGLLARDPRYVADALPITAVALVAAFHEPPGAPAPTRHYPRVRARVTLPVVLNVVAVLVVSCLVTTSKLAPVSRHDYSSNFARGVLREMTAHPERSVVSTAAPFVVSARADVAQMMEAIGAEVEFDRPATQMYVFDGIAVMHPMDLLAGTAVVRGPEEGCGWELGSGWTSVGVMQPGTDPVRVLRLGYLSAEPADLEMRVGGRTQRLSLPAGLGRAFFVVPAEGGRIEVRGGSASGTCISDRADGPPWVAQ